MRAALILMSSMLAISAARAEPANTLRALGEKLEGCLASVRLHSDSEATVRLMLKRDGSILGTPRITYAKVLGDQTVRASDAAAIAEGLLRCLPVEITDGLGGAIAGRMITFSFGLHKAQDL